MQVSPEELLLEASQMALEIRLLNKRIQILEAQLASLTKEETSD